MYNQEKMFVCLLCSHVGKKKKYMEVEFAFILGHAGEDGLMVSIVRRASRN